MDPSTSTSGDVEAELTLYLSHAREQKTFVKRLNDCLQRAQHATFFDKETSREGSHFPPEIKRALDDCKLAVLVLSHDYLSSKCSMLELGWLMSQSKSILPLFKHIEIKKLKCGDNLAKCNPEQAEPWKKNVKKLGSINGVVCKHPSEFAYIDDVVTAICKLIQPYIPYDVSYVQGREDIAKEIEGHFDAPVADNRHCGKARMVGLHGVAGSGKTTLCKTMANRFASRYIGRSCLMEFPKNYDEQEVVEACKEALEKLANCESNNILEVQSFEEVIKLMKKHVSKLDVFLVIDNVWESSVEAVQKLLEIGFTADSKVLMTSRSEAVLKELLSHNPSKSYNWYIGSLPALTLTDAFQIFQESLNRGDLTSLLCRDEIENLLNRRRHQGKHHPLTLKELAKLVRRSCGAGDLKMDGNGFSRVLGGIRDIDLKAVNDAIKPNYEDLEEHQKHMFLDIALWIWIQCSYGNNGFLERTHANAGRWLCCLYKETPVNINAAIYDLAMAGVIQIERAEDGQEMIQVHNLYMGLAQKEAAYSSRFLITSKKLGERIDWSNLERVFLEPYTNMVQFHQCRQIQFLYANGITPEQRISVMEMPSLRVLILRSVQKEEDPGTSSHINFNGFMQLRFLWLEDGHVESLEGLNSLRNLRMLTILNCCSMKDIEALRCLTQLEVLSIRNCHTLKGSLDLGEATSLERLELVGNESLEKVEGRLGPNLKEVDVRGCTVLKVILDLSGATALKEVVVEGCTALKRIPDLSGATTLERLVLRGNESLEKVEGRLNPAAKIVVEGCPALKGIIVDQSGLLLDMSTVQLND